MALSNYGMLSKSVVSEYFRWAKSNNAITSEPWPLKDDKNLFRQFENAKDAHIIEIIHKLFGKEPIAVDDVMYFLDCSIEKATTILKRFEDELKDINDIF